MEQNNKFYSKTQFVKNRINVWRESLDVDFPIHYHDYSELVIITKGSAIHIIDGMDYSIQAGDVYVIKGNTTHGFKEVENLVLYNIAYTDDEPILEYDYLRVMSGFHALFYVEPMCRKPIDFEHKLHLRRNDLIFTEKLLEIMASEDEEDSQLNRITRIYFTTLITFFSRLYERNSISSITLVSDVLAYIEKNYTEQFEIEDLANKAHVSTRHFTRLFINNYNITPKQYIMRLRMQQACRQLIETKKSIRDIALSCGFNDTNYFSYYFKKKLNTTPRAYRIEKESSNNK